MGIKKRVIIVIWILMLILISSILIFYPRISFYWHFRIDYDHENQGYMLKGVRHWTKEILILPDHTPDGNPIVILDAIIETYQEENHTIKEVVIPDSYEIVNVGFCEFLPSLEKITIGKSVTQLFGGCFGTNVALSEIIISEENPVYIGEGNCIIERDTKQLITGCKNSTIPNWVESIGDAAFVYVNFSEIEIPNSVKKIGGSAFFRCGNLQTIYLSQNIEIILHNAFYECESLTIFCEVPQKPDGWDNEWYYDVQNVFFGEK